MVQNIINKKFYNNDKYSNDSNALAIISVNFSKKVKCIESLCNISHYWTYNYYYYYVKYCEKKCKTAYSVDLT